MTRWFAALLLSAANAAYSADIRIEIPETPTSPAVVTVMGHFGATDYDAFIDAAQYMKRATIYFSSEGGLARDALLIGQVIRSKGFNTAVADHRLCLSACAFAWLAGAKRFLGKAAAVGFHAPFDIKTGERLAFWESAVNIYVRRMGLPDNVAVYILEPDPKHLNLLFSEADGKAHGIELTKLPIREFIPLP
jgi:hypothetical protein